MKPKIHLLPTIILLILLALAAAGFHPITRYSGHFTVIFYTDSGFTEIL